MYYEVTAAGFDGSSDETDHLVVWVRDPEGELEKMSPEAYGATVVELPPRPGVSIDFWLTISDERREFLQFLKKAHRDHTGASAEGAS